jgi:sulfoxide reductase heme-binding subunit YedZ
MPHLLESATPRAHSAAAPPARPLNPNALLLHRAVKPVLFVALLIPYGQLLCGAIADTLGPNPAEALIRGSGDWTLRLLCLTLAVTPLRTLTGWHALARLRRMLGLFAFFYGSQHFLAYAWLDMGFEPGPIVADIAKRPFILVGATALLLMLPLAATSFNRAIKTLGAARWQLLHRTVYAIAGLAVMHFFWMRAGKNDFAEVGVYAAIVGTLLGWRLWSRRRRHVAPGRAASPGK